MTKAVVTRVFLGSAVTVIAGVVLAVVAISIALASGTFIMEGPDVIGFQPSSVTWLAGGLAIVAVLAMIGGFIGGLVSWIGALLNTSRLEDKTWFIVLLVLGLLSFGLVAMLAYVIGGPDGTSLTARRTTLTPA